MREAVERLSLVPDGGRDFTVGPDVARAVYGFDEESLDALVELGLAHASGPVGPLFAEVDLHYIGLRTGRAPVHRLVMRSWAAMLARCAVPDASTVSISYIAGRPPDPAQGWAMTPDGRVAVTVREREPTISVPMTPRSEWPGPTPPLAALLTEIGNLDFCLLTPPTSHQDFARRHGLANCATASCLLLEECQREGFTARSAYGLLVAIPHSVPHHWVEVLVGDVWTPFAPLLVGILHRFAGLNRDRWPVTRSPGSVLLRLGAVEQPILQVGDRRVDVSFATEVAVPTDVSPGR